jgi:hypothetical protein
MPRKALVIAFLVGWLLSLVLSPAAVLGMFRSKTGKPA